MGSGKEWWKSTGPYDGWEVGYERKGRVSWVFANPPCSTPSQDVKGATGFSSSLSIHFLVVTLSCLGH